MKLLSAKFENFRFLRDLEITFSTDEKRNLTVIRAANESGKTTTLHALQWALYGDSALPGKGIDFYLYPIDWDIKNGRRVPVSATVEFEVTNYHKVGSSMREVRRQYRLIRSAFEEVDRKGPRPPDTVRLFEIANGGAKLIDVPEALIHEELPPELREVFFTDGDRALSFIETDVNVATKRSRVENAIRSLLGLGLLDDAIYHVGKSAAEVNKEAKKGSTSGELHKIASRLVEIDELKDKLQLDLSDAKLQFTNFDQELSAVDRKIDDALVKGDKEKLQKDLEQAKKKIKSIDAQLEAANKDHSALFRSQSLALDLLAPVLAPAYAKLDELHDQRKIPNTTVPVLQDRLSTELCICGESLTPNDADGKRRRGHIEKLIDDSQRADEIQAIMTDLYFGAKQLQSPASRWNDDFKKIFDRLEGLQTMRDEAGRDYKRLDQQLDALPDTDIQGLRDVRRDYKAQRDRQLARQSTLQAQLDGLAQEQKKHEESRDRLLREQKKGARILAELHMSQDVLKVLKSSYDRITTEELRKVSDYMNKIFLEMIGADPDRQTIIRRAEINSEFDIIVYGPSDRTLNPDRDLNGASRRALTLAFVLALTKVSEVEAPNVIDTPLGMTSGYVKRSILRTAIRESAQLVLFLTHDEITGCEDILDEAAGAIFTLTNPAHYPKMLVNDPAAIELRALKCNCTHRSTCRLCDRLLDEKLQLELVS